MIELETELHAKLKKIAKEQNKPMSVLLDEAVDAFVAVKTVSFRATTTISSPS